MRRLMISLFMIAATGQAGAQDPGVMRQGVPPVLKPGEQAERPKGRAAAARAEFQNWNERYGRPGLIVAWEPFVDQTISERLKSAFIGTLINAGARIEDAGEGISFVIDDDGPQSPPARRPSAPPESTTPEVAGSPIPQQLLRPDVEELPLDDPSIPQDPTGFVDPATTPDYDAPTVYDYAESPTTYETVPDGGMPEFRQASYWIFISAIESGTPVRRPIYRVRISRTDDGTQLADFTSTGRRIAARRERYRASSRGFIEDTRPVGPPGPEAMGTILAFRVMAALAK